MSASQTPGVAEDSVDLKEEDLEAVEAKPEAKEIGRTNVTGPDHLQEGVTVETAEEVMMRDNAQRRGKLAESVERLATLPEHADREVNREANHNNAQVHGNAQRTRIEEEARQHTVEETQARKLRQKHQSCLQLQGWIPSLCWRWSQNLRKYLPTAA